MYITFPFKCSVLSFTDSIRKQNTKKKKKKKKKNARNAWMRSFLFPLKPRIFDIGIIIREKKYRKLQCRTNERKTPIFYCKTTVVNNAELSSLSGYWSGVPCKNANFACNVISEAGSLAVEKQWFHWLSGWNAVLIAYLWLFLLFSGRNSFYLIIFLSKSRKNLVAQTEYNEESYRDLFNYILFYLNMKPQFRHLDFFTKYSSFVYETLHEKSRCRIRGFIFFQLPFTQKNVKKCRVWCFSGSDLVVLLKIQSDFAKYFIHSCKDEILYNIKTYKLKHILQFAKMRINRAVYKNSWI